MIDYKMNNEDFLYQNNDLVLFEDDSVIYMQNIKNIIQTQMGSDIVEKEKGVEYDRFLKIKSQDKMKQFLLRFIEFDELFVDFNIENFLIQREYLSFTIVIFNKVSSNIGIQL